MTTPEELTGTTIGHKLHRSLGLVKQALGHPSKTIKDWAAVAFPPDGPVTQIFRFEQAEKGVAGSYPWKLVRIVPTTPEEEAEMDSVLRQYGSSIIQHMSMVEPKPSASGPAALPPPAPRAAPPPTSAFHANKTLSLMAPLSAPTPRAPAAPAPTTVAPATALGRAPHASAATATATAVPAAAAPFRPLAGPVRVLLEGSAESPAGGINRGPVPHHIAGSGSVFGINGMARPISSVTNMSGSIGDLPFDLLLTQPAPSATMAVSGLYDGSWAARLANVGGGVMSQQEGAGAAVQAEPGEVNQAPPLLLPAADALPSIARHAAPAAPPAPAVVAAVSGHANVLQEADLNQQPPVIGIKPRGRPRGGAKRTAAEAEAEGQAAEDEAPAQVSRSGRVRRAPVHLGD
jgi:hypothetical protein